MLRIEDVYKTFNQGVENKVINGVNVSINEKEFIVITGKSGSGKSTLLYLMSGLEKPTKGKILFKGKDISGFDDNQLSSLRRKTFGFVFQFYNLVASLSAFDNIFLPITIERKVNQEEKERVLDFAKEIGLYDKLSFYPHQLSGGEQQRVAIVRALAINPEIIFADEPTGNLDSISREDVLKVFETLHKAYGKTIVMVTHDESISSRFATKELYLENGKIIRETSV